DILNDAASLYEELVRKKNEDPQWHVAIEWEGHKIYIEPVKSLN
ncbi:21106_t:CDS:1, partial [Gigaspora rosea]